MIIQWIFLILAIWAVPSTSLVCYECRCPSANVSACNCLATLTAPEGSHCTIVEDFYSSDPYIQMTSSLLNVSYVRMKDPYYIAVDQSIFYNEASTSIEMEGKRIVYGCDWDLCNDYSLISTLPDAFKLTIDSTWFTTNIYGAGTTTDCHSCTNEVCGNQTQPIDYNLCPFTTCTNATTCSLYHRWHDIGTDTSCYQSTCTTSAFEDEFSNDNKNYRVLIGATVYLAQNRSNFDIWKLNVNCAVDNCSRSTIFQEIKEQISSETSNLGTFPSVRPTTTTTTQLTTTTAPRTLACYNCSCNGTTCPCTTYEVSSRDRTYCVIWRRNTAQDISIEYGHVNIDSSYFYIRDYPYVIIRESIVFKQTTGRWDTRIEFITYGCDWDLCNSPTLLPYLPNSFQMRLPEAWLNTTVIGTGAPTRSCHECPEAAQCGTTDFLDASRCPIESCNTTCVVSDTFNDPAAGLLCYKSYCAPQDASFLVVDPYRVEIEAILYAIRPTNVEIWEIDLYCRADDCSRPELFRELRQNVVFQPGDVTYLFNLTVDVPKIRCFDCYCEFEHNCTCDTVTPSIAATTYCSISRYFDKEYVYTYFYHLDYAATYPNVHEFPFVMVDESIYYDNETGEWYSWTDEVLYGCNWDYCNKPGLIPLLPSSLQIRLPEAWLNSNILGTGQPAHDCHQCIEDLICRNKTSITGDLCPTQACNTTCFASYRYNNPVSSERCYQAFCTPPDSEEFTYDTARVQIQGIVYSGQPTAVELWEVYTYCRADNCSHPDIFQEIATQLIVDLGNISLVFNQTNVGEPGQLHCYQCMCVNDPNCMCNKTVALIDNTTYCTVIRLYDGQNFHIILEHIARNSSRVYIREFPFLLVEESIIYNEFNGRWDTRPNLIVYGCNTDFCNDPRLVPKLPIGFQIRLPEVWLNQSVLGTGQPVRSCHECPDAPQCGTTDFLDASRCPIEPCNTTCVVSDKFNDPAAGLLCYQSFCAPPDSLYVAADPYRVEIAAILYGNRPNAQVEFWEVDVYCQADDCSRPELFKELKQNMIVDPGDLSAFFNMTNLPTTTPAPPVEPTLSCYQCTCYDNPTCSCNVVRPDSAYSTYCSIVRINYPTGGYSIELEHINKNSSRVNIKKFPFVLAEETILYNETSQMWNTRPSVVIYGCNWHLCNHPSLAPLLPNSFKMTLSDEWLNNNVLDKGASIRKCHECPAAPQCGTANFLNGTNCPIQDCNNTCVVSDLYDDPFSGLLCYQSYCAPEETDFEMFQNRVELDGIIYGDRMDTVELWEIDIYCRANDCTRPEIFDEIRQNFTLQTNNISVLLDNSTRPIAEPQIICYDCFCYDDPYCACDTYTTYDATASYCTIIRQNFGDDFFIALEHISRNSTRVYIREFPYLLVEETILYDNTTGRWNTRNNIVVYGCNWDYCNDPKLLPDLPDSFQMHLPEYWLNSTVLGSGLPVRECHECPDAPQCGTTQFLNATQCPIKPCNTTCLVSDTFNDPLLGLLCYQSFCAPPDSEFFTIDPHRVELEGIIYGSRPTNVELWEIDVFCRGDDCSRPDLFKEIRSHLCVELGDYTVFLGNASVVQSNNSTPLCSSTTTPASTTGRTTISSSATGSVTTSRISSTTASQTSSSKPITTTTAEKSTSSPTTVTTRITSTKFNVGLRLSTCFIQTMIIVAFLMMFRIN